MLRINDFGQQAIIYRHYRKAVFEKLIKQIYRQLFLAAVDECAAVNIDDQRCRLFCGGFPQIKNIALVRAVFSVDNIGLRLGNFSFFRFIFFLCETVESQQQNGKYDCEKVFQDGFVLW